MLTVRCEKVREEIEVVMFRGDTEYIGRRMLSFELPSRRSRRKPEETYGCNEDKKLVGEFHGSD